MTRSDGHKMSDTITKAQEISWVRRCQEYFSYLLWCASIQSLVRLTRKLWRRERTPSWPRSRWNHPFLGVRWFSPRSTRWTCWTLEVWGPLGLWIWDFRYGFNLAVLGRNCVWGLLKLRLCNFWDHQSGLSLSRFAVQLQWQAAWSMFSDRGDWQLVRS